MTSRSRLRARRVLAALAAVALLALPARGAIADARLSALAPGAMVGADINKKLIISTVVGEVPPTWQPASGPLNLTFYGQDDTGLGITQVAANLYSPAGKLIYAFGVVTPKVDALPNSYTYPATLTSALNLDEGTYSIRFSVTVCDPPGDLSDGRARCVAQTATVSFQVLAQPKLSMTAAAHAEPGTCGDAGAIDFTATRDTDSNVSASAVTLTLTGPDTNVTVPMTGSGPYTYRATGLTPGSYRYSVSYAGSGLTGSTPSAQVELGCTPKPAPHMTLSVSQPDPIVCGSGASADASIVVSHVAGSTVPDRVLVRTRHTGGEWSEWQDIGAGSAGGSWTSAVTLTEGESVEVEAATSTAGVAADGGTALLPVDSPVTRTMVCTPPTLTMTATADATAAGCDEGGTLTVNAAVVEGSTVQPTSVQVVLNGPGIEETTPMTGSGPYHYERTNLPPGQYTYRVEYSGGTASGTTTAGSAVVGAAAEGACSPSDPEEPTDPPGPSGPGQGGDPAPGSGDPADDQGKTGGAGQNTDTPSTDTPSTGTPSTGTPGTGRPDTGRAESASSGTNTAPPQPSPPVSPRPSATPDATQRPPTATPSFAPQPVVSAHPTGTLDVPSAAPTAGASTVTARAEPDSSVVRHVKPLVGPATSGSQRATTLAHAVTIEAETATVDEPHQANDVLAYTGADSVAATTTGAGALLTFGLLAWLVARRHRQPSPTM